MLPLFTSIISLVIGYFFSKFQQHYSEKRTRISERFEKLYAPFEKMIWLRTKGTFCFSDLDPQLQQDFIELLFNNYEYADSKLKILLMHFKWSYDSKDFQGSNDNFFLIMKQISAAFNLLSKKLFLEPFSLKEVNTVLKDLEDLENSRKTL